MTAKKRFGKSPVTPVPGVERCFWCARHTTRMQVYEKAEVVACPEHTHSRLTNLGEFQGIVSIPE